MKVTLFSLDFSTVILRFALLMAIVIVSFFIGQAWLSILSLPVFMSALVGARFTWKTAAKKSTSASEAQVYGMPHAAH